MARGSVIQIVVSDGTITDPEVVGFVWECFHQTGGTPRVNANLKQSGLWPFELEKPSARLKAAEASGSLELASVFSKARLAKFCENVINSMVEAQHLEILSDLKPGQADEELRRLREASFASE